MGETAGLDRLAQVAPLIGVRGADDAPDARTEAPLRMLRLGEARVGCLFDPKLHGLAVEADPFSPAEDWKQKAKALFDGPIEVLLYASTHRPHVAEIDGLLVVNPGSAVLPADGANASFAWLTMEDGRLSARIANV
jgi:predicted phosphodiesterase